MTDHDIAKMFERLKVEKQLDLPFDSQDAWERMAVSVGLDKNAKPARYGLRDHLEYYIYRATHVTARPLATGFALFAFLFIGWIGAANASFDTLPGDRLYPVKLAMERTQLAFAVDPQSHASLQLEFTSRRLTEMVELTAERNLANPVRVRMAVERIKTDVDAISEELGQENSAELAKALGRKSEQYKSTVQSTPNDVPQEVADQVAQVQELIDNAQEQAVQVIITVHEEGQDEEVAHELEGAFQTQLSAIDVGENEQLQEKIELAKALAKEKAYRRAFQILKEVELLLKQE